ncbi:putative ATP-dependent RNA helicase, partial [Fasciola hepatica]
IHRSRACPPDRGILIFLTGEDEIVRCCALINQLSRLRRVDNTTPNDSSDVLVNNSRNSESCAIRVFSLFASLPQNKQLTALSFAQPNCRKVIVSTNLAETSITIPGIRYVIDCGYAKVRYWDTQSGLESFRIQRISKSQAWQRAGRAGREAAGVCLRLYTDAEYKKMALHPQPELVRAPMAGVLLNLIAMNVKCPLQFPWLTSPKAASVEASLLLLQRLDAVEQDTASTGGAEEATNKPYLNGNHELLKSSPRHSLSASDVQLTKPLRLTQLGSLMSAFPLDPRFSRVLVSSAHLGCFVEILSILSMLYVSPVFYVPTEKREEFSEIRQRFYHPDGDLISLLLVYRAYVKSSRVNDPKYSRVEAPVSRTESNQFWCRAHFLNRGRLNTAVKVRAQLKQIARGCGLTGFRSCGANLNLVAQAFLQSGFRDQVALLADPALLSSSGTQVVQELGQSRRSVYTLVGLTQSVADRFFIIHPESQLYPASLSDAPPAALLFIETVTQSVMGNEKLTEEKVDSHALTYMRHVSTIQWGSQLESNDRSEFFNWLTNLVTVTKNNPVNRQKRSDFSSSFADGKRVKRRCLLHSYFAAPTTPTNTDADHSTTSFNHICETTPSNTDADHLTASFNHVNETLPTVSQTGLSKKKLKRLAARRKRKRLLAATMHS